MKWQFAKLFLLLMIVLMLMAGSTPRRKAVPANSIAVSLNALPVVESGDLVFRRTNSVGGQFVAMLDREQSFSHVGIAYTGMDKVYVIHVLPVGNEEVRIEPLQTFVEQSTSLAIYRPHGIEQRVISNAVRNALSWVGRKRFDRDFDIFSDNMLYCTELVYKAYKDAGIDITDGQFNSVDFPFLKVKEVIYPSLIIESGHFTLIYSTVTPLKGDER